MAAQSVLDRVLRARGTRRAAMGSPAVRELASRYFAGVAPADADAVAARLLRQGLDVGLTYLSGPDDAVGSELAALSGLVAEMGQAAIGAEVSLRPGTLGIATDFVAARRAAGEFVSVMREAGVRVMLESEEPGLLDTTVELWRQLRVDGFDVGVTIPVNLRRAERYSRELSEEGARIRLCFGAYPGDNDFRRQQDKALSFVRCLKISMAGRGPVVVATHDPRLVAIAQELGARHRRSDYEFQMLYGVRPLEQRRLVDIGLVCRTYVPFGPGWYDHLAERIAARPRYLLQYLRAVLDPR